MKVYITTAEKFLDGLYLYNATTGAYKDKKKAEEITQQMIKRQMFIWENAKLEELREENFYCAKIQFKNNVKRFMIVEQELE